MLDHQTVLVVEDEPDLLELVSTVLEMEGLDVRRAANGAEALDEVARGMPAVVLLDLKMPVMDGAQFARLFRARYGDAVPIVVMTAADDVRRRAAEVGAAAFLGKPFEIQALLDVISGVVH